MHRRRSSPCFRSGAQWRGGMALHLGSRRQAVQRGGLDASGDPAAAAQQRQEEEGQLDGMPGSARVEKPCWYPEKCHCSAHPSGSALWSHLTAEQGLALGSHFTTRLDQGLKTHGIHTNVMELGKAARCGGGVL